MLGFDLEMLRLLGSAVRGLGDHQGWRAPASRYRFLPASLGLARLKQCCLECSLQCGHVGAIAGTSVPVELLFEGVAR